MKRIKVFLAGHPWFSLLAFPVILFLLMLLMGLPFILGGAHLPRPAAVVYRVLLLLLFLFLALLYPFILTAFNVYFIIKVKLDRFWKMISAVTEASAILLGFCLSWLYITVVAQIAFVDWDVPLYGSQVHSPIATWTFPTIAALSFTGVAGYLILRVVPLRQMSPLAVVTAMAAMYLGCMVCALWLIQTCRPNRGGVYLYLFPVNCILIAIKVVRGLVWRWQEQERQVPPPGNAAPQEERNRFKGQVKAILYSSRNWPWLAFLLMIPLFWILAASMTLFGQEPDSLINAWTHTSQWNLSQEVSPPNFDF